MPELRYLFARRQGLELRWWQARVSYWRGLLACYELVVAGGSCAQLDGSRACLGAISTRTNNTRSPGCDAQSIYATAAAGGRRR